MDTEFTLNDSLGRIQKAFIRRLSLYILSVIVLSVLISVLSVRYFSPVIAVLIVFLAFIVIFLLIEIIKKQRLIRLLNFLEELLINGFYVHAYYLVRVMSDYYSGEWLEKLMKDFVNLAGIYSSEKLLYNNSELYDKELDNIISLIDFNIDVYKDFYLHNKSAVDSYQEQLESLDESFSVLDSIYNEQKKVLEVEKYRLEAFEQMKLYFQNLKKEQIRSMFNVPKIIDTDKDYGRFVNQLLDKAVYSAEARAILNKIFRAKTRFYEVFSDILKAKNREEIKEKLNYLFSS